MNLGVANLLYNQYNELFFNPAFYDYIPTETFLVFQTDSMILPENKNKIYNYLNYDYVGAPWGMNLLYLNGNGGLSLRKKSKMLELLSYYSPYLRMPKIGMCYNEDIYFSGIFFPNISMNKANFKEACNFSVESVCEDCGTHPFGIHKVWRYSPYVQMLTNYPYIEKLKNLQI